MSVHYYAHDFSKDELTQIRQLITEGPEHSRAELSRLICRMLRWYKADGGLKDMSRSDFDAKNA